MAEKKQTKSYKKLFIEIAESRGYKVNRPSYSERKGNVDFILEGQKNGKSSEVRIDLKKKNGIKFFTPNNFPAQAVAAK